MNMNKKMIIAVSVVTVAASSLGFQLFQANKQIAQLEKQLQAQETVIDISPNEAQLFAEYRAANPISNGGGSGSMVVRLNVNDSEKEMIISRRAGFASAEEAKQAGFIQPGGAMDMSKAKRSVMLPL